MKDPRTAGQRRHGALLDALKVAVGSGSLEKTGGVLATVVLTLGAEDYLTGTGFATTSHGAQVPVREAMTWAGGDYRLFGTVLNSLKQIAAYSSTHRLFTEGQRLAMIARDAGCAFPGLSRPTWLVPGSAPRRSRRRWTHHRRQRHTAVRVSPPRIRPPRLDRPPRRRPTRMDTTQMDRPATKPIRT